MKRIILLFFTLISFVANSQSLQTPSEFLGYELGTKFTRHHRIVEYFEYVAKTLPNVKVVQYGKTNEGRPLIVAIVSSQKNFDNLEQIRQDNLKRTGLASGEPSGEKIPIVWLSYNVHGNESVSSEATMKTLYYLADPGNQKSQEWLKNTVVILDPCINPDGRDRYANFYNQYGNLIPNPDLDSKEHHEPWPGGRANHYLYDLNRDWAWQTQVESQARIKLYNQWMPEIHVDFHEQGLNSPYYFAPAAEPYHEVITPWQREFQTIIGKNNAKYFDQNGWLYFTKERFDLLYPSYGDTYPIYNGAIGMTFEKGGGGRAGLAGLMENSDTVKLSDRINHHFTTGISTVEVTSQNAVKVVDQFTKYFSDARTNPKGVYKSFIIKSDNNPDKLNTLKTWLDRLGISYGIAGVSRSSKGFNYQTGKEESFTISDKDMVISMYQPRSTMARVLFEPKTKLSDSITYDITAWSVPYIYDLKAYATSDRVNPSTDNSATAFTPLIGDDKPYAYIGRYQSQKDLQWVSYLMRKGIQVRITLEPFSQGGTNFDRGTILALRWDNEHNDLFDYVVRESSQLFQKEIIKTNSGFVDSGKDFGSGYVGFVKIPRVAVVSGSQVSSTSFGEVWYFFEQEIKYPVTVLDTDYLTNTDLSKYDVLIVPSGFYRLFDEKYLSEVKDWVRGGGRLILIDRALNAFADKEGFSLSRYASEEEKKSAELKEEKEQEKMKLQRYEDQERNYVSATIPGAIFKVDVDNSHPLAFGYPDHYFTLKNNESRFAYLNDGWNVGVIKDASRAHIDGFVGARIMDDLDKSLDFGVENMGRGQVVYFVDNPLFRSFWYSAKMLFGNAVFFAGE